MIRHLSLASIALFCTLLTGCGSQSAEQAEPPQDKLARTVLNSIKAHGGVKAIEALRSQAGIVSTKGWGPLAQSPVAPHGEFSMVESFVLPNRLHRVWTGTHEGTTRQLISIEKEKKAWGFENGVAKFAVDREGPIQVMPMATLFSLVDAIGHRLELKEGVELDPNQIVIEMRANDRLVGSHIFDRETSRLVGSIQTQVTDQGVLEIKTEYKDFREVAGVLMPFQVTSLQNGKEILKVQIQSVQIPAQLSDSLFEVPGERQMSSKAAATKR